MKPQLPSSMFGHPQTVKSEGRTRWPPGAPQLRVAEGTPHDLPKKETVTGRSVTTVKARSFDCKELKPQASSAKRRRAPRAELAPCRRSRRRPRRRPAPARRRPAGPARRSSPRARAAHAQVRRGRWQGQDSNPKKPS